MAQSDGLGEHLGYFFPFILRIAFKIVSAIACLRVFFSASGTVLYLTFTL